MWFEGSVSLPDWCQRRCLTPISPPLLHCKSVIKVSLASAQIPCWSGSKKHLRWKRYYTVAMTISWVRHITAINGILFYLVSSWPWSYCVQSISISHLKDKIQWHLPTLVFFCKPEWANYPTTFKDLLKAPCFTLLVNEKAPRINIWVLHNSTLKCFTAKRDRKWTWTWTWI